MTLSQAITRLTTRFKIGQDAEIDTTDTAAMTTALVQAAKKFSRDSYALFEMQSAFTLTAGQEEYDLLNASVSAKPIFHVYGVHINNAWLEELSYQEFVDNNPDYHDQDNQSNPWCYTAFQDSKIRIQSPPNATAVAATDNFIRGFYEHPTYTYGSNSATELLTPAHQHELIIDRAYLDNSTSYVNGAPGYQKWITLSTKYDNEVFGTRNTAGIRKQNLARYKKERVEGGLGRTRRYFGLGSIR